MKSIKALVTNNGYCVNVPVEDKVITFFVSKELEYQPWKKTIDKGILPPTNEYGRLKNQVGLSQVVLDLRSEGIVRAIAAQLHKNPLMGIDKFTVRERKRKRFVDDKGFAIKNLENVAPVNLTVAPELALPVVNKKEKQRKIVVSQHGLGALSSLIVL